MSYSSNYIRVDQLHNECRVRVKGDQTCKLLTSKLMRNGIEPGEREMSSLGRPYFEYRIITDTRSKYARAANIIESTDDVELID